MTAFFDSSRKLRIAVVGTGAIGSYHGAKLAASGHDVRFLLRSGLETVRSQGFTVHSTTDTPVIRLPRARVFGSTEEIGPVDWVLIAVKTTANAALEKLIPPLLHDGTTLVTMQNGLGNEAFLAERFGVERVMGALCFVGVNRIAPGVVHSFGRGTISVGEYEGPPRARTEALAQAFRDTGMEATVVDNLLTERWRKELWNVPFNGLAIAAGDMTCDLILADPGLMELVRGLMRELLAIAEARGHAIPDSYIDFQLSRTRPLGAYKPSSLLDYRAGRPVEVESIWGEPVREARQVGVQAGRLEALYYLLQRLTAARVAQKNSAAR
ncbi:MAG: 2-dehydropantoate 2-reductase [Chthoniobacteraceae bacterium]|nr:2-dehydropantoate 2-reductase [Chthoniobacteraceae bacterium]